jgi:hypothetical protein
MDPQVQLSGFHPGFCLIQANRPTSPEESSFNTVDIAGFTHRSVVIQSKVKSSLGSQPDLSKIPGSFLGNATASGIIRQNAAKAADAP